MNHKDFWRATGLDILLRSDLVCSQEITSREAKGGAACPFAVRTEIRLATFDLWRLLCLQSFLITDANQRGTILNRRRRELSRVHEQHDDIDARFMRRVEALDLGKAPVLDLARRLAQRAQETAG